MNTFNKSNLNKAFKSLRTAGFLAEQNYLCCGHCAGYALANTAEKLVADGKTVNGAVFYHKQAGAVLTETRLNRNPVFLRIQYNNLNTTRAGIVGLPTIRIAKIVTETFDTFNVPYEWDGNIESTIKVRVA